MGHPQKAFIALLTLGVGACSPYVYKDQVSGVNAEFAKISTSWSTGRQQLTAERNRAKRIAWLAQRPVLTLKDCSVDAKTPPACTIVVRSPEPDPVARAAPQAPRPADQPVGRPAEPETGVDACAVVAPKAQTFAQPAQEAADELRPLQRDQIVKVVGNYFSGMAALTNAQDRAEFDAAAGQVSTAVATATAAATGNPLGIAIGSVAKATTNVFLWIVGTDLDWRRYRMLRDASAQACQPIRTLAAVITVMFEELVGNRKDVNRQALDAQVSRLNQARVNSAVTDEVYNALLDEAFQLAAEFDALRAVQPEALGQAISDANDKLTLAIWSNDGQFDALIMATEELNSRVEEVTEAWGTLNQPSQSAR